jgi:hypothetical protein
MQTIEQIIARWDSGEGKPYKGKLIDARAYNGDGVEPPTDIGCMCAGGQVLHLLGGWTPRMLMDSWQDAADKAVAQILGISKIHAILLRNVNDSVDGSPSIVLTHPELVLGDQAPAVLAFWRHLDAVSRERWDAAMDAAMDADGDADGGVPMAAAWAAAGGAAGTAARGAAGGVPMAAAWAAALATNEIQGAAVMREKGQAFFFLPLFGFSRPEDVLLADGATKRTAT